VALLKKLNAGLYKQKQSILQWNWYQSCTYRWATSQYC